MKRLTIAPAYVSLVPERLSDGILYICERYGVAAHKCCCGCGEDVVTPLTPADWSITNASGSVTMHPSIGNWGMACQSHYWIRRNRIMWARAMSPNEIGRVRARDRIDKQAYVARVNLSKQRPGESAHSPKHQGAVAGPLLCRMWITVITWWHS